MDAAKSDDDEATPSMVKAPPARPRFVTPHSGGLTFEEIATVAYGLTQAIIAGRSNPTTTPPPKHSTLSSPTPYEEDKTERRHCATEREETRQSLQCEG